MSDTNIILKTLYKIILEGNLMNKYDINLKTDVKKEPKIEKINALIMLKNIIDSFGKKKFYGIVITLSIILFAISLLIIVSCSININSVNSNQWKTVNGTKINEKTNLPNIWNCNNINSCDSKVSTFDLKFTINNIDYIKKNLVDIGTSVIDGQYMGYYKDNLISKESDIILIRPYDFDVQVKITDILVLVFGLIFLILSVIVFTMSVLQLINKNTDKSSLLVNFL